MPSFLFNGLILLLLLVVAVTLTVRDPRRFRCAIWWGITSYWAVLAATGAAQTLLSSVSEEVSAMTLLGASLALLLTILVLAGLLIAGGARLIHRESLSLSHSLSLLLGLLIIGYVALVVGAALMEHLQLFAFLLVLAIPLAYLGFVLVCYVGYSAAYAFWVRHFARTPKAVVVLGAGLNGDQLTPLLRARADLGLKVWRQAKEAGTEPYLVASGGQGPGETIPEARALAKYFQEHGVNVVVEEDTSTTTAENLKNTAQLLPPSAQPWRAVTSDYHAFRAALILRQLGIKGQGEGARTPPYFWASATLREYVALLKTHWKINSFALFVSLLPFLTAIVIWLSNV